MEAAKKPGAKSSYKEITEADPAYQTALAFKAEVEAKMGETYEKYIPKKLAIRDRPNNPRYIRIDVGGPKLLEILIAGDLLSENRDRDCLCTCNYVEPKKKKVEKKIEPEPDKDLEDL